MTAEYYKARDLIASLEQWQKLGKKTRRSLINELGAMAIESASDDGDFAIACNSAAKVMYAVSKYPELTQLIEERQQEVTEQDDS